MVSPELYSQKPAGEGKADRYMWGYAACCGARDRGEEGGVCQMWLQEKNKVIKHSEFGWKFKSNLLTWRTAKSASILSPVSRAGRLRRSLRVMVRHKELDHKRHAWPLTLVSQRKRGLSTALSCFQGFKCHSCKWRKVEATFHWESLDSWRSCVVESSVTASLLAKLVKRLN